jgi:phosphoenolpyruvate synthase/pyruvate phosphate dikinase
MAGDAGEERWEAAWRAITGVWASKWNERAFLACRKAGLKHADLNMAVLCQQVCARGKRRICFDANRTFGVRVGRCAHAAANPSNSLASVGVVLHGPFSVAQP